MASRTYEEVTEGMADSNEVVLSADIVKANVANRKLVGFRVERAAPHVVTHVTDLEFESVAVLLELARLGYKVMIQPAVQSVSVGGYFAATDIVDRAQDLQGNIQWDF